MIVDDRRMNCGQEYRGFRSGRWVRASFILLCGAMTVLGAPKHPVTEAQIIAEQAYDDAKSRYQTNLFNADAAWQFARACFDRADLADRDSERAALGRQGIEVCRQLLKRDPNVAAAHYYLGMNLGQLAQTKSLGALPLVREMQKEWDTALALDQHIDFAGPDRNLGMLYRDAPGAPLSIGNRVEAVQHLMRAVELNPEYPENHLNLIESQINWNQLAEASREDEKLRKILPAARTQLSGPRWQGPWRDWQARQDAIETKLTQWRNTLLRRREP
jgi:tetratricopeptide (TPR) repeat protein